MKKKIFAICTIIAIFSCMYSVYAESNVKNEIITKEYTENSLNKEEFYKNLENTINENGKNYILKNVTENENKQIQERNIEFEKNLVVNSPNIKDWINQIEKKFDYESYGYKGQVFLDEESISIKKNNSYTKEYKVYYEQKYYNLPSNDLKDIPKTVKVNEQIYYLVNPVWYIAETTNINGDSVPIKYNAVMQYEGLKTEDVTLDYIAYFKDTTGFVVVVLFVFAQGSYLGC